MSDNNLNMASEEVMRCQRRKKIHAVNAFGGQCQICGYKKCIDALEFHHIDESTKKAKPSHVIMRWSWERAKEELDKCMLVCANCHREIHAKEFDFELQNHVLPWIEMECATCKEVFQTKKKSQKFCSTSCMGQHNRKVVRPTKTELKKLLNKKVSWREIGRQFGVSDSAVIKWAKSYGLVEMAPKL